MRSTEETPPESRAQRAARIKNFGALLTDAAIRAGYDVRPRAGGRQRLADDIGLDVSTVSRALDGKSLPLPGAMQRYAGALGVRVSDLLVESGLLSRDEVPDRPDLQEVKVPATPDEAADSLGVTHPQVRPMLLASIKQAIRLQAEADAAERQGASAKG
ncbi:helix-turn-helix transcriptional regulator [Streptomyces sp. NPDC007084]|uniref:helix-turn-helix domain-containing protein n=1 Tax=Streptomyces sp. NPDC007084 TaxID=3154313 RepID=UPI00345300DF